MVIGPDSVIIEESKIVNYLLASAHPIGGAKARFFRRHGFQRGRPQELSAALREHLRRGDVSAPEKTDFGTKWVCRGSLRCPDGHTRMIVSVWIRNVGDHYPRLVTAYPRRSA